MKGWVRPKFDKEGTYSVSIDTEIHPYIKEGDRIKFTDVLVPYKVR